MGYNHSDYKEMSYTDTEASYEIGTVYGSLFRAESILFLATTVCFVRLNSSAGVQHLIPAGDYIGFDRKCVMIYVERVTVNGTLSIWAEGDILR